MISKLYDSDYFSHMCILGFIFSTLILVFALLTKIEIDEKGSFEFGIMDKIDRLIVFGVFGGYATLNLLLFIIRYISICRILKFGIDTEAEIVSIEKGKNETSINFNKLQ